MKLTEEEKRELKNLSQLPRLKEDMRLLSNNRHNPFLIDGKIVLDRYITFLNEYNSFINHIQKPFHKIIDKDMKL